MIYLDSAATSFQKPPQVLRAYADTLRNAASPGRGAYRAAMLASERMLDAREEAASFFRFVDPERVVLTMNATHALNLAIHSLAEKGKKAVISGFEHNSVLRPLVDSGMEVTAAGRRLFDPEELLRSFARELPGASLAVCTHVSNAFGFILPVREISAMCRRQGIPFILDASQSAGILPIDCEELEADFVAMPGHKSLLGVPGSGLLLCRGLTSPLLQGGSGSDSLDRAMPAYLPDRLEAGTQNAPAAALAAGIRYIRKRGRASIEAHERALCLHMAELLRKHDDLELFCGPEECQSGVLSLRSRSHGCEELAAKLSAADICVRSGLHCSPLAHESAGTLGTGTLRMSFSPFNTHAEIERAAEELTKII